MDCDLIVVGAGGGMAGALRAAELGGHVVLIEASEHFRRGNNTAMSTAMFPGAGTRWQHDAGVTDSADQFYDDIMRKTKGTAEPVVSRALVDVSAELVEWLGDYVGLELSLVTDFEYPGHSAYRCHTIEGRKGDRVVTHMAARVQAEPNIDLLCPARMVDVLVVDGAVTGVVVEFPDGSREQITARAVVLATNGYGADPTQVAQYIPEISSALYHGSPESRGDAIRIGHELGAQLSCMDAYQGHAAVAVHGTTLAGWATIMKGGFMVNRSGERFGNETTGYSEYASVLAAQPDATGFIIIDQHIHDACMAFRDFAETVESGALRWADSVSDLAERIGVSATALQTAVDECAAVAATGTPDGFGRAHVAAVLTAPYAAIQVRPALFHTQGGLAVDAHARVLRSDGSVIPGLYASGGAAVGVSGKGASGYLAGNGLLPAFGLGYLAATHVMSAA